MLHHQYELVQGTTHWVAWFTAEQLADALSRGWHVLHAWKETGLVLNKEGKLVLPQE